MKADEIILQEQDKLNVIAEAPHEKQTIVGNIVPFKGHILFEIDCSTGKIIPAVYNEINTSLKGEVKRKVITKPNCLYVSCLNKKSAIKKYIKWLAQKIIEQRK